MDTDSMDTAEGASLKFVKKVEFGPNEEDSDSVEIPEDMETHHVSATVEDDEDEVDGSAGQNQVTSDAIGETLKPIQEDDEEGGNGEENGDKEGKNIEEDEEDRDMTLEEKHAMVTTVRQGDIDLLDDLLDNKVTDINMKWYNENLLMVAIRANQLDMAYFLIDNGVDFRYTIQHFQHASNRVAEEEVLSKEEEQREPGKDGKPKKMKKKEREREKQKQQERLHEKEFGAMEVFETTCRQMAYDRWMMEIVDIIDEENGEVWPWQCAIERPIRLKKTLEEKLRERGELVEEEGGSQRAVSPAEGDAEEQVEEDEEEDGSDKESDEGSQENSKLSRQTSLKGDKNKDDRKSNSRKSALSSASKVTLNVESMTSCDASSGYDSMSSQTTIPTPTIILDYSSTPQRSTQYSYHVTKSFLSRKQMAMEYKKSRCTIENDRPFTGRGSFRQESKFWTLSDSSRTPDNVVSAERSRSQSLTRYVSPWREDDPRVVSHLRKRAVSSLHPRDRAPDYKRSVTLPDINTTPIPAPTVRSESTLYQNNTPRLQLRQDGRHAQSAITLRHSRMDISPPRYTRSEGGSPTRYSRCDVTPRRLPSSRSGMSYNDDLFSNRERENSDMSILSPRAAKVCRQGWSVFKDSDNKKRLKQITEKKSLGAKKYSPAGMIKTAKDDVSTSTKSRNTTVTRSSRNVSSESAIFVC